MKYERIERASFLERLNRFIAYVDLYGKKEKVHVKNTGRCRELLTDGAEVYLEKSSNPARSTAYDLVAVKKGDRIVNMDSTAPNAAAGEWLRKGGLYPETEMVKPECTFGNSRFDFYIKAGEREIWMEVKGVNLEENNTALFPDAPSERALKHVEELIGAAGQGYEAVLLFVIQMEGIRRFAPNRETQPEFADLLIRAEKAGVRILAMGCTVTPEGMEISYEVPVILEDNSPQDVSRIAPLLLDWYDSHHRSLPWRENVTPYRVWISEIMLQQTRVEAVKPYYARFMERFPDVADLAEAPDDVLLKLWEGLGYYSRARNLKKAAGQVMELFGGKMPTERKELLTLAGIGSYTAGAVASIAGQQAVPAVDGNVLRVYARYLADDRDMSNGKVKQSVEEHLERIMPQDRPGDYNQALMELGATVCLPNGAPKCDACPLRELCLAHRQGCELDFPRKAPKKGRTIEEKTILVIRDGSRAAIRRRPEKGLLAGLYEFPSINGKVSQDEVLRFIKEKGLRAIRIHQLPEAKHIFTHREWHMTGYAVRVDELEPYGGEWDGVLFVDTARIQNEYPIPAAYAAYAGYLDIRLGNDAAVNNKNEEPG